MKKTNQYMLLVVCAIGVAAFSTKLTAADSAMPGCCGMAAMMETNADAKADAAVTPDLLTTCPVSGDKLGEMGKPHTFTYKGQEVKLCCSMCKAKFDKDPEKYMAKIRAADKK